MNRNLWLLAALSGLFLTNNIVFIAINGLVGLSLAPYGWMATLPVMAYVVGGALATGPVARHQAAFGRKRSFQLGLVVALGSALLCAFAAATRNFWLNVLDGMAFVFGMSMVSRLTVMPLFVARLSSERWVQGLLPTITSQ